MHCEVFSKGCLLTYFRMCMYKSNNILFSSVSHIFFFICSTNNHNPYIFISHFLSFFIIFFSYFPHLLTFPFAFPHAKKTQRTNLFIIRAHITRASELSPLSLGFLLTWLAVCPDSPWRTEGMLSEAFYMMAESLGDEPDFSTFENKTGLAEDMKFLASMPELCDVTFLVGDTREPVCAVRAVLAARSR